MTEQNTTEVTATEAPAKAKPVKKFTPRDQITQAQVQKRFDIGEDGYLYLAEDTRTGVKGSFAGSIRLADGYYSIVFEGLNYSGAMLAHFHKHGVWPEKAAAVKPAAETTTREPRKPPVITEEMKAAAKAKLKAKKAPTDPQMLQNQPAVDLDSVSI